MDLKTKRGWGRKRRRIRTNERKTGNESRITGGGRYEGLAGRRKRRKEENVARVVE